MAEEFLEINENDDVTSIEEPVSCSSYEEQENDVNEQVTEQQFNPFLDYLQKCFSEEKSLEYISTLDEEQKSFISSFILGFQSAIGRNIVGVYDYSYIEGFHFTIELLQSLNIVLKPIEVEDKNMKFVLVAQF